MAVTVTLFDHIGLRLIIEYPPGIRYTAQAGGNLCRQPEIEGLLVPIGINLDAEGRRHSMPVGVLKQTGSAATSDIA